MYESLDSQGALNDEVFMLKLLDLMSFVAGLMMACVIYFGLIKGF